MQLKTTTLFVEVKWIYAQSRSYQAVKRETLAAQAFHRFCTNQDRKHKKPGRRCAATTSGSLGIFRNSSQTVVKGKHSFVKKPYTEVQVSGKCYPEKIRNLQPCCKLVDFAERQNHQQDQDPQYDQPYECKTKCLKVEEYNAPEKIECQLD